MGNSIIAKAKAYFFSLGSTDVNENANGFCERVFTFYLYDWCAESVDPVREQIHEKALAIELDPGIYACSIFSYRERTHYLYTFRIREEVEPVFHYVHAGIYEDPTLYRQIVVGESVSYVCEPLTVITPV